MLCAMFGLWCPQVDAFCDPDRNDLTVHEVIVDVGSVQGCRDSVLAAAIQISNGAIMNVASDLPEMISAESKFRRRL